MPSINTELGERALSKMQHEMDWKPLKERCLRMYPTWSSRQVDRILREYQRFLALKVATRDIYDTIVLAPILLDAMWKQHIISTQQYYADCQMLLQANQIMHYNAEAVVNLKSSVRSKRMELTKASLCMMFSGISTLSSDSKGIWDYGEGDTAIETQMSYALSSMDNDTHDDEVIQVPGRPELPLLDTTQDDERTEEDIEMEVSKKSRKNSANRKKERQRQRTHFSTNPVANVNSEQDRLLFVYRAGKVSKLQVAYPNETILHIKAKIQRKSGLTPQEQYLEWEGMELEDDRSIGHYSIPNDAALVLTRVKPLSQPIDTSILEQHQHQQHQSRVEVLESEEGETETGDAVDERDDPDLRPQRHSSPNRRRSRPSEVPPRSPRPPKPPRQQVHHHHQQQLPYSPSAATDDSYMTSTSLVHDPHRRQHALLNKLKIDDRDNRHHQRQIERDDINLHNDAHHRQESYTEDPLSSSRPRPKASSQPLQIFVNTIMGFTITLSAHGSDTVYDLKQQIEEQEDIPFSKQILILEGVPLNDGQQLADYTSEESLHVLLRLQAGTHSVASTNSVGGASTSMLVGSSTMATVPRKATNKLLVRASAATGHGNDMASPLSVDPRRPAWR